MNSRNRPRTTSFTVRRPAAVLTLAALAVLTLASACGGPIREPVVISEDQLNQFLADKPPVLKPLYEKVLREGPGNVVLNQMQAGLAAMSLGEYRLAEESFDQALNGIEAVYANNEVAEKARSLWRKEGAKDFKGEPYERVMAYYYRGLLYMRRGDYENARACFKAGILQDALAEEEQYRCDFALMIFLEGWCSRQLGAQDLARQSFDELKTLRPDFRIPPQDHNCLVIVETGTSPLKVAVGEDGAMLGMERGRGFKEAWSRVTVGGRTWPAFRMENIAWQAATRGGRQFDGILAGKVKFKKVNDAVGNFLQTAGVAAMAAGGRKNDTSLQLIGLAVALLGTAQRVMAHAVETQADTRYWSNLPDTVHVLTGRLTPQASPGKTPAGPNKPTAPPATDAPIFSPGQPVLVKYFEEGGSEVPGMTGRTNVQPINNGSSGLAWIRSRSADFPAESGVE